MREYVGIVTSVAGETFMLTYKGRDGQKQLSARLVPPDPTKEIVVGARIKIIGDWAGNLGAGTLTTFTAREIEFLK